MRLPGNDDNGVNRLRGLAERRDDAADSRRVSLVVAMK